MRIKRVSHTPAEMKLYAVAVLKSAVMIAGVIAGGLFLGAGVSQIVRAQPVTPSADTADTATLQSAATADVKRWLRETTSLKADFVQQGVDGSIVRGTFTMQQPGQMRFDYEPSVEMLIVADGKSVYFIDYEVRQLSRYPLKETPLAPLLKLDELNTLDLQAIEVRDGPMAGTLAVTSKDPKHREYGVLTMMFERVSPEGKLALRGWSVLDAQGNLTQITLQSTQENVQIAKNAFKFKDPRRRGPRTR